MSFVQKTGVIGTALLGIVALSSCVGSTKNIDNNRAMLTKNINYDSAAKIKGMQDKVYAQAAMQINKSKDSSDSIPVKTATYADKSTKITKSKYLEQSLNLADLISDFIRSDSEDYLEEKNSNND